MNNSIQENPDFGKLSLPELLKHMPDKEFVGIALTGFSDPEEVQKLVLKQILETSSKTEFGKLHGFDAIKSVDDFLKKIPISEWKDYEDYADRMADGERDILFPGLAGMFVKTSGTTAGKSKLVPESEVGAIAKSVVSRFRKVQLALNFPKFDRTGLVLPLSNAFPSPPTKAGIPVGFASGLALSQNISDGPGMRFAVPADILFNEDTATREYLLMRFAMVHKNVIMVVGNNAGSFTKLVLLAASRAEEIIRDIELGTLSNTLKIDSSVLEKIMPLLSPDPERADELRKILTATGRLLPKDYWPSLQLMAFWISSTVGHYVNELKALLSEEVLFFDAGYGSSEVRINIPSKPWDPAGTLSIYTAFYEFLPTGGDKTLLAHELVDGSSYELIVTTWSGLYRYNMKDIVKVEGFTVNTPNITFQYKSNDVLNLCDEKIPASVVQQTILEVVKSLGIKAVQIQIYADPDERRYLCYLEPVATKTEFNKAEISNLVHQILVASSFIYDICCNQQKLLNPLRIVEMRTGWQSSLYEARVKITGSSSQVKLPVMIREKPDNQWIKY